MVKQANKDNKKYCKYCLKSYTLKHYKYKHVNTTFHKKNKLEYKKGPQTRMFTCKKCDFQSEYKHVVQRHQTAKHVAKSQQRLHDMHNLPSKMLCTMLLSGLRHKINYLESNIKLAKDNKRLAGKNYNRNFDYYLTKGPRKLKNLQENKKALKKIYDERFKQKKQQPKQITDRKAMINQMRSEWKAESMKVDKMADKRRKKIEKKMIQGNMRMIEIRGKENGEPEHITAHKVAMYEYNKIKPSEASFKIGICLRGKKRCIARLQNEILDINDEETKKEMSQKIADLQQQEKELRHFKKALNC